VLQSQQRRAQAQIDYYRALAEYNKSLNYVDYLKGTMLANNNIVLREGAWNKKAYWDALERARERSAGHELQYGVTRPGVVRTGPLRDAASASEIIGSGAMTHGETITPDGLMLSDPNDPLGLNLEPYRNPVEINDQPLEALGDRPADLLSPMNGPEGLQPLQTPTPAPSLSAPQSVAPVPDTLPNRDALPNQTSNGRSQWQTAEKIQPAAYQARAEQPTAVEYAPEPVRRRPIVR
jgi:hypothetical protein